MSEQADRSLANKLNRLFASVTLRNGFEFSNEHVARAIGERTGVTISQSYIWQLRKGKKDNPTLKHLQALADFFGVPAGLWHRTRSLDHRIFLDPSRAGSGYV